MRRVSWKSNIATGLVPYGCDTRCVKWLAQPSSRWTERSPLRISVAIMCPPSGRCARCGKHARYAWLTRSLCQRCFDEVQNRRKAELLEYNLRVARRKEARELEAANPIFEVKTYTTEFSLTPGQWLMSTQVYGIPGSVAETENHEVQPDVLCGTRPISFED